ncbi:MAG: xanthine dehydrogenase family protein subunit M [Thermodesulfobacteriota bacterium]|nr:xanthine dehydrogenase family protein subunit M [Thermodesulfobacteriota bacterium]
MNWIAYEKPKTLDEGLTLLEQAKGRGRVIAGGTDLFLQLKRREYFADLLVDITGIQEMKQILEGDGWVRIGAGVTHGEVAKNSLIQLEAKALAQGCGQVGSPQIRNMGTLVGNVVSAQPAADGAIPLMVLEAELKVVDRAAGRWIALEDAYRGVGLSAVDPANEVVTEVRFRKPGDYCRTGFFRMARRKALALPILNGAVSIRLDSSKDRIERARIAIGPVAEKPFRSRKAEACLESTGISQKNFHEACRIASEEANPRTSLRGSASYRKEMVRVHLFRTIERILNELRKTK